MVNPTLSAAAGNISLVFLVTAYLKLDRSLILVSWDETCHILLLTIGFDKVAYLILIMNH